MEQFPRPGTPLSGICRSPGGGRLYAFPGILDGLAALGLSISENKREDAQSEFPTNAPDPEPGDFDAELETISETDLEFVEAGSGLEISIEVLVEGTEMRTLQRRGQHFGPYRGPEGWSCDCNV